MSSFNSSEFNNILFGEPSLDSPPPENIVTVSAVIICGTEIDIHFGQIKDSNFEIETESTLYIKSKRYVGFGPSEINTDTTTNIKLNARYNASFEITDSGSEIYIGTIGHCVIDTSSIVTSNITVDYDVTPIVITTDTIVSAYGTLDAILQSDITGSSIVDSQTSNYLSTTIDITGESSLSVDADAPYKRLQADITGDSELVINCSIIQGSSGVIIDSGTTTNVQAHYLASGIATINTESFFLSLKWASATITGNTTLVMNAQAPEQLKELGRRRRVSFVFEVDNGRSNSSILDEHYKIFKFYNSLVNINQTLDYVRRVSTNEIKSYDIYSTSHVSWVGNESIVNLTTGQRGIVQKNATGIFYGKDGYFAIYKGPEVIDGILQIEE